MADALVLSLFPGIGLLDMAFELEGFCVVRGPDVLWGGDVRRFHPPAGRFDGVIGGPPCQMFSSLAHIVRHNGHQIRFGNLIPEFERCVAAAKPAWFVMENVPKAPDPVVDDYAVWTVVLNNRWFGEEQNRVRKWCFGVRGDEPRALMIETVALENPRFEYAATGAGNRSSLSNGGDPRRKKQAARQLRNNRRSSSVFKKLCRLQGLPDGFDIEPFTVDAKCKAIGNGVPLPMGRAVARAVAEATETIEPSVRT